jgi:Acetyltransferase (GNAT) family
MPEGARTVGAIQVSLGVNVSSLRSQISEARAALNELAKPGTAALRTINYQVNLKPRPDKVKQLAGETATELKKALKDIEIEVDPVFHLAAKATDRLRKQLEDELKAGKGVDVPLGEFKFDAVKAKADIAEKLKGIRVPIEVYYETPRGGGGGGGGGPAPAGGGPRRPSPPPAAPPASGGGAAPSSTSGRRARAATQTAQAEEREARQEATAAAQHTPTTESPTAKQTRLRRERAERDRARSAEQSAQAEQAASRREATATAAPAAAPAAAPKGYPCSEPGCGQTFPTVSAKISHVNTAHPTSRNARAPKRPAAAAPAPRPAPVVVTPPPQTAPTPQAAPAGQFVCSECGAAWGTQASLNAHFRGKHGRALAKKLRAEQVNTDARRAGAAVQGAYGAAGIPGAAVAGARAGHAGDQVPLAGRGPNEPPRVRTGQERLSQDELRAHPVHLTPEEVARNEALGRGTGGRRIDVGPGGRPAHSNVGPGPDAGRLVRRASSSGLGLPHEPQIRKSAMEIFAQSMQSEISGLDRQYKANRSPEALKAREALLAWTQRGDLRPMQEWDPRIADMIETFEESLGPTGQPLPLSEDTAKLYHDIHEQVGQFVSSERLGTPDQSERARTRGQRTYRKAGDPSRDVYTRTVFDAAGNPVDVPVNPRLMVAQAVASTIGAHIPTLANVNARLQKAGGPIAGSSALGEAVRGRGGAVRMRRPRVGQPAAAPSEAEAGGTIEEEIEAASGFTDVAPKPRPVQRARTRKKPERTEVAGTAASNPPSKDEPLTSPEQYAADARAALEARHAFQQERDKHWLHVAGKHQDWLDRKLNAPGTDRGEIAEHQKGLAEALREHEKVQLKISKLPPLALGGYIPAALGYGTFKVHRPFGQKGLGLGTGVNIARLNTYEYKKARAEHLRKQPYCVTCGTGRYEARVRHNPLTVGHMEPQSSGHDPWDPTNWVTQCRSCNSKMGHLSLREALVQQDPEFRLWSEPRKYKKPTHPVNELNEVRRRAQGGRTGKIRFTNIPTDVVGKPLPREFASERIPRAMWDFLIPGNSWDSTIWGEHLPTRKSDSQDVGLGLTGEWGWLQNLHPGRVLGDDEALKSWMAGVTRRRPAVDVIGDPRPPRMRIKPHAGGGDVGDPDLADRPYAAVDRFAPRGAGGPYGKMKIEALNPGAYRRDADAFAHLKANFPKGKPGLSIRHMKKPYSHEYYTLARDAQGNIVGYLAMGENKKKPGVFPYVHSQLRGRGIGSALYNYAEHKGFRVEEASLQEALGNTQSLHGHALWRSRMRQNGMNEDQIRYIEYATNYRDYDWSKRLPNMPPGLDMQFPGDPGTTALMTPAGLSRKRDRELRRHGYDLSSPAIGAIARRTLEHRAGGGLIGRMLAQTIDNSGKVKPGMEARSAELNALLGMKHGAAAGTGGAMRRRHWVPKDLTPRAGGGNGQHQPYLVGEQGREVFVPEESGWIIPHHLMDQLPKRAGGGRLVQANAAGQPYYTHGPRKGQFAAHFECPYEPGRFFATKANLDTHVARFHGAQQQATPPPTPAPPLPFNAAAGTHQPPPHLNTAAAQAAQQAAQQLNQVAAALKNVAGAAGGARMQMRAGARAGAGGGGMWPGGGAPGPRFGMFPGGGAPGAPPVGAPPSPGRGGRPPGAGGGPTATTISGRYSVSPESRYEIEQRTAHRGEALGAKIEETRQSILMANQLAPTRAFATAGGQLMQFAVGGREGIRRRTGEAQASLNRASKLRNKAEKADRDYESGLDKYKQMAEEYRGLTKGSKEQLDMQQKMRATAAGLRREKGVVAERYTGAEAAQAQAQGLAEHILTKPQQVRAMAAGGIGMIGAGIAFSAGMKAVEFGLDALGKAFAPVLDAMLGFSETSNKIISGMVETYRQSGGNIGVVSSQMAQSGLSADMASKILPAIGDRVQLEAGNKNIQQQIDYLKTWVNVTKGGTLQNATQRGIPGLTAPTGGLFGTSLFAVPSTAEQIAGMAGPSSNEQAIRSWMQTGSMMLPGVGPLLAGFANLTGPQGGTMNVDDTITYLHGQAKKAGDGFAQFNKDVKPEDLVATGAALKAIGAEDDVITRIVGRGIGITGPQGQAMSQAKTPEEAAGWAQSALQAINVGSQTATPELLVAEMKRGLTAQFRQIERERQLQLTTLLPGQFAMNLAANPLPTTAGQGISPLAGGQATTSMGLTIPGTSGGQAGASALGALGPQFASVTSSVGSALSNYSGDIEAADQELTKYASDGENKMRALAASAGVPAEEFNKQLDAVKSLGSAIRDLNERETNLQSGFEMAQYNHGLYLAKRNLGDLVGLAGKDAASFKAVTGFQKDGKAVMDEQVVAATQLGKLNRDQWELGRQSQQLSMMMSQRQLNFQLALSRISTPGSTPEERATRAREAAAEAAVQQQQLDIQKKMFGNEKQIFTITVSREVQDAIASLQEMEAGQAITIEIKGIEALKTVDQELLATKTAVLDTSTAAAQQWLEAGNQAQTAIEAQSSTFLGLFATEISTAMGEITASPDFQKIWDVLNNNGSGSGNPLNPSDPGGGSLPETGAPGSNNAAGAMFMTAGATDITVGEAGTEQVAVLRNPRKFMYSPGKLPPGVTRFEHPGYTKGPSYYQGRAPGVNFASPFGSGQQLSGGGGGAAATFNVSIVNPTVRDDRDITELVRQVEMALNRKALNMGLNLRT